jgi:sugar phosphate permease
MGSSKKLIIVGLITAAIIAVLVAIIFLVQKSNAPAQTDSQRFYDLKRECDDTYKKETEGGIHILRYPCADTDIKQLFKERYGREYN